MIILGLGSNIGDRLHHLRTAIIYLRQLPVLTIEQVSPLYLSDALLPENAPDDWNQPYLNLAIRCQTSLQPLELLVHLKAIEHEIGRKPLKRHWGPRVLDIDLLVYDHVIMDTETLTIPHKQMLDRPFALWPLADVAPFWRFPLPGPEQGKPAAELVLKWGSRFDGKAPLHTRQINQRVDTPALVGILNVTPDSCTDTGQFQHIEQAVAHARTLVESGAEIIDIGAESTSPLATPITAETEWARLAPVLNALLAEKATFLIPPKISVDTRYPETAKNALVLGVDWINDVSGLTSLSMREILASSTADVIMMHHLTLPASSNQTFPWSTNVVDAVIGWGEQQLIALEKSGIAAKRIIFDPGIGFGKTAAQSWQLIQHAECFATLGVRLFMGHSRKSFLSLITANPYQSSDIETATIALQLAERPIDYLRVHHVEMVARALRTIKMLAKNA